MKRTKHKFLTVFLSFCMFISCMVGMTVTAYADSVYESYKTDGTLVTIEGVNDVSWYIIDYNDATVTLFPTQCIAASMYNDSDGRVSTSDVVKVTGK